jgi:two-component system OmpR family response regulator
MQRHTSEVLDSNLVMPITATMGTMGNVLSPLAGFAFPNFALPAAARQLSVLIADDDPNVAPLVNAALRPYHVQTETVGSGADALARMRVRRYDLIVLDLEMADIHGFEVLRALRELSPNQHVPVLVLTANTTHEALAESFGHGADEFVKKPFDLTEFGVRAFRLIRPLH